MLVYDASDGKLVRVSVPHVARARRSTRNGRGLDVDDDGEGLRRGRCGGASASRTSRRPGSGILVEVEEDGGEQVLVWLELGASAWQPWSNGAGARRHGRWSRFRPGAAWRRLAAGDRDALAPLMERHYRRLYRIALSYLRDPDDALDAVQETFVKAFQNAARWDGAPRRVPGSRASRSTSRSTATGARRRRRATFSAARDGEATTTRRWPRDEPSPERGWSGRELGAAHRGRAAGAAGAAARRLRPAPLRGDEPGGDRGQRWA